MKNLIQEWFMPSLVVGLVALAGPSIAQEQEEEVLEIVNQDGIRVNVQGVHWQDEEQGNVVVTSDLQAKDGKIIIIDDNGDRREIDVSGARNIIVNKSVRSIIRDGEEQKEITGQAIIVGPDGKKQVIQLGEGLDELGELGGVISRLELTPFFERSLSSEEGDGKRRLPQNFFFQRREMPGKYMLGVSCQQVDESLRAHLDLPEGAGLMVTGEPTADSPAGKAGIQNHDVLMYAGDDALNNVDDLVEAVQTAGKEEQEIEFRLMRRGKEIELKVKPVERANMVFGKARLLPEGEVDFQFEEFGPGVLLEAERSLPEGLLDRFEQMDEKIQARMEELEKLKEELREWKQKDRDDD